MPRVVSEPPRLPHILVELLKLGIDLAVRFARLPDSTVSTKACQQMNQCRPILMHEPTKGSRTVASWQMVGQISGHRALIKPSQLEPLSAHPVGKVRDAAKINASGACRVAASLKVLRELGYVRLKRTLPQPCP